MQPQPPTNRRQVGGDHYLKHAIQPWDIIAEYGLDFWEGCALKYLLRTKPGVSRIEDLEKAIHCLEHEITLCREIRSVADEIISEIKKGTP